MDSIDLEKEFDFFMRHYKADFKRSVHWHCCVIAKGIHSTYARLHSDIVKWTSLNFTCIMSTILLLDTLI